MVNRLQLGIKIVAIKAPIFQASEILEDIAAFTDGELLGDYYSVHSEYTLEKSDPVRYLGKISSCKINTKETILKGSQNTSNKI